MHPPEPHQLDLKFFLFCFPIYVKTSTFHLKILIVWFGSKSFSALECSLGLCVRVAYWGVRPSAAFLRSQAGRCALSNVCPPTPPFCQRWPRPSGLKYRGQLQHSQANSDQMGGDVSFAFQLVTWDVQLIKLEWRFLYLKGIYYKETTNTWN